MNEIRSVWVVSGWTDCDMENCTDCDMESCPVYTHAFETKDEAMAIQRRGRAELPMLNWTLDCMNYGNMDFANHMLDKLVEDFSEEVKE